MQSQSLQIGLFGFGNVGAGIYEILNQQQRPEIQIKSIVVKNPHKKRNLSESNFNYQTQAILDDDEINVVVELIDDADAAFHIVKKALESKKHVVTANKKMLAYHLDELQHLAQHNGVALLYEASVCGSIPILKNLEESFGYDPIHSVKAISNGTCNYILTHLFNKDQSFEVILKDAQKKGFAESNPTLDIDGWDSKFKLIITNLHAFGLLNNPDEIVNLGIRNIKVEDVHFAKNHGLSIKLIGKSVVEDNQVISYVAPQFIDETEAIHAVEFENNAVEVDAKWANQQLFQGKGAGGIPTASAVFSDLLSVLKGYSYTYVKQKNNNFQLHTDKKLKVYISATSLPHLDTIQLQSETERVSADGFHYKVGELSLRQLKHQYEKTKPSVFIALFS